MKTVKEVSRDTGVSVRTLHHYHAIGLLKPTQVTDAGYRLYDEAAEDRLRLIVLYRELGFSLRDIAALLDATDTERNAALAEQIDRMEKRKRQLQLRIDMAQGVRMRGIRGLDMKGFEAGQIDQCGEQARVLYQNTDAWKEWEQKSRHYTEEDEQAMGEGLEAMFVKLGGMRHLAPDSPEAQAWAAELRQFITDHCYTCTLPILRYLGSSYAGGGSFTESIDQAGGPGTGKLAGEIMKVYCDRMEG